MRDEEWMEEALGEAEAAMEAGEVPIGSVLVEDGEEISRGQPRVGRDGRTASHNELLTLLEAGDLSEKSGELALYTTLQPCLMCFSAAIRCGVDRIVYGMEAENETSIEVLTDLEQHGIETPEMKSGVKETDSVLLFKKFQKNRTDHFAREYVEELLKPYQSIEWKVRLKVRKTFQDCENGFHNFQHTREFVEAARRICEREEVSKKDKKNVVLAGWLHDIGAVEKYEGHVERGVKKAGKILKDLGLEEERIEDIQDLIAATDPQKEPEDLLEEVMQDSDAAFLGREDYFDKLEGMWREFSEQGIFKGDLEDFFRDSISYTDIEYHTDTARELFEEERKENLRKLREKVS